MPTIYALKGRHDSGKTTTLKLLETTLISKYLSHKIIYRTGATDIVVIMDINGQRLGISSGGDSESIVLKNLNKLISHNCDYIFCATRSRGKTVAAVKGFSNSHTIHFESKLPNLNNDASVVSLLMKLSGL